MDTTEILTQSIDKTQVPPLHQKRILAFVNHFLISSCTFLSEFALNCESKFIELERKLQKVEAALIIIEAKLSSIPDTQKEDTVVLAEEPTNSSLPENENIESATTATSDLQTESEPNGIRAADDARYKKFFKMLQFGVPAAGVKIKMRAEGVDPSILETPNLLLTDGTSA